MSKNHQIESEDLYSRAREVVRWGFRNGLLHQPPDEPSDHAETGESMIADAVGRAIRLSIGNRNAVVRTDYEGFDETPESSTEDEAEMEAETEPEAKAELEVAGGRTRAFKV